MYSLIFINLENEIIEQSFEIMEKSQVISKSRTELSRVGPLVSTLEQWPNVNTSTHLLGMNLQLEGVWAFPGVFLFDLGVLWC